MPEHRCVVTAPVPLAGDLDFAELAMVVTADALVRRAWALGRAAELLIPTLGGDLATEYGFEKELARAGQDVDSLGPALGGRRAAFLEERRVETAKVLARLSVAADVGAPITAPAEVARAARTAFVKLFDEGLVHENDRVVATCPRCRTALDAADTESGEIDGEYLTLAVPTSTGAVLRVRLCDPELLPGVVAIAVPEDAREVGASALVPFAGDRAVPVVASAVHAEPAIVVPAHDGHSHELALRLGLPVLPVLDTEGTVRAAGPLQGLGRYAARAAARALLEAEGVLVAAEAAGEEVSRCRCCGTVVIPRLERHWFLQAAELEILAADAIRNGGVGFTPPDARDALLARAGARPPWCLSASVPGGVALPAATCLECRYVNVDVETPASCGKCMGSLVEDNRSLDARFVAAVWAVTLGGWPGRGPGSSRPDETLAVASSGDLVSWVLPAIALGLRLAGTAPFSGAIVHPWPDVDPPDTPAFLGGERDHRVLRMALIAGTEDVEAAAAAVEALDRPSDDTAVDGGGAAEAAAAGIAALDEGAPAQAAGLLASALATGVPADAADRLRALALPILGD